MRVLKVYLFQMGTKIPFSKWHDIIHSFLNEQNLTSGSFLYYFSNLFLKDTGNPDDMKNTGCHRIVRDCPALGEVRISDDGEGSSELFVSNIDGEPMDSDKMILPLINKIYRRYAFSDTYLYYYDIDFFCRGIPFERAADLSAEEQLFGSGIVLHRGCLGDNYLELSVDVYHDGKIFDSTPYFKALQELLGGIKARSGMKVLLPAEERKNIAEIEENAAYELLACVDYFTEKLSFFEYGYPGKYSVAPTLKKLCNRHGYHYKRIFQNYVFRMEKRTTQGNVVVIEIATGPTRCQVDVTVSYQGLGFKQYLGHCVCAPENQIEFDGDMTKDHGDRCGL